MQPYKFGDNIAVPLTKTESSTINSFLEYSKGTSPHGFVETDRDWEVLENLIGMWQAYYPFHAEEFKETLKHYKDQHNLNNAIGKDGSGFIQHQLEIPQKLYQLIGVMFPNQHWDKNFVHKFVTRFAIFNVSNSNI